VVRGSARKKVEKLLKNPLTNPAIGAIMITELRENTSPTQIQNSKGE
jgi:hypothetical protein